MCSRCRKSNNSYSWHHIYRHRHNQKSGKRDMSISPCALDRVKWRRENFKTKQQRMRAQNIFEDRDLFATITAGADGVPDTRSKWTKPSEVRSGDVLEDEGRVLFVTHASTSRNSGSTPQTTTIHSIILGSGKLSNTCTFDTSEHGDGEESRIVFVLSKSEAVATVQLLLDEFKGTARA